MKRTLGLSLAGVCLLLLVPGVSAPLAGSEPPPSFVAAAADPRLPWESVDDGVDVIRLWVHLEPGLKNETALLRLTDEKHELLKEGGADFLNHYTGKIFSKPINGMSPCTSKTREGAPSNRTGLYWYAMMPHWPDSNCLCLSYLDWMPETPTE